MFKNAKTANNHICEYCDFTCCKLSNWTKHISTRKHMNRTNIEQKEDKNAVFHCKQCNKEYKARNSLWYHEQKCAIQTEPDKSPYLDIINKLLADNTELKNFIIEQSKVTADTMTKAIECCKNSNSTTVINQTNNKAFNINMYLNEDCKNAINFSDFIKNIEITYEDLENNAQLGFVDGMSKIFIDSLNKLDKNKRPMHCTDVKRETMYIKDDDKWVKETSDAKLQKGIQTVSYKSIGKLMEWKKENPDYRDSDSKFSNQCMVMHKNSIAGYDRDIYYPKVIHSIAKEIVVDK